VPGEKLDGRWDIYVATNLCVPEMEHLGLVINAINAELPPRSASPNLIGVSIATSAVESSTVAVGAFVRVEGPTLDLRFQEQAGNATAILACSGETCRADFAGQSIELSLAGFETEHVLLGATVTTASAAAEVEPRRCMRAHPLEGDERRVTIRSNARFVGDLTSACSFFHACTPEGDSPATGGICCRKESGEPVFGPGECTRDCAVWPLSIDMVVSPAERVLDGGG
jgi:hypothetical protein